ncbi:MAG: hypothetical protein JW839_19280 [Candidatus Lokiarchaeota archaeon]|nr:hypothetical protein [Candidatus Lokiarchaeota archaeon]
MAVLLAIFDTRLGPVSFMVIPRSFNEKIVKKTVKLMDFVHDDEFFIQDNVDDGIKSINMPISITSKWARGQAEMAQLSVFTTEEAPQLDAFKRNMLDFKEELAKEPDIYMAFYAGNRREYIPASYFGTAEGKAIDPAQLDRLIAEKHGMLAAMLDGLYDQLRIVTPTTYASMLPIASIAAAEQVPFPRSALNELKDLAASKSASRAFTVFRKVGDMMKVDMIPCSGRAIKVRIIVKALTPEFIMRTARVIELPLLFTSGICQEKAGRCSYEAYFAVPGDVEETTARVKAGLETLDKVEKVEITVVG